MRHDGWTAERLLTILLGHLLPRNDTPSRLDAFDRTLDDIRVGFPAAVDRLADHPVEMVETESRDFFPGSPGDPREDW